MFPRRLSSLAVAAVIAAQVPAVEALAVGADGAPPWAFDPSEVYPGGAATAEVFNERAYSQFPPGLGFIDQGSFKRGDHLFRGVHRGLGPLYNARSCQGCHVHDGRGHPPSHGDETMVSMFLRLSVPGVGPHGGPRPEPRYGDQLQTFAMAGPGGEGHSFVDYETIQGQYPDGEPFELRRPIYKVRALTEGPLAPTVMFSPRVAPPVYGLGLIEAIPAAAIEARADPRDRDGDGISGRVNRVWDAVAGRAAAPGRFGYKAASPSLLQQLAGAYRGDMGVTNESRQVTKGMGTYLPRGYGGHQSPVPRGVL